MPLARSRMLTVTLYFVVLAWTYHLATPPFEPTDEASHFLYSYNVLREGALPVLEARAVVFASKSVQRHHPPLYYLMGALLLNGLLDDMPDLAPFIRENPQASIGSDIGVNYHVALHPLSDDMTREERALRDGVNRLRALSLLLGCVTLWASYAALARMFGARVGVLGAFLMANVPTFVHLSVSANNDALNNSLFALGVLGSVQVWQARRVTWRQSALLGGLLAGIALTKVNGLVLFGVVYGTAAAAVLARRISWRDALRLVAVTSALVLLLAGWWYARNWQLYGDPLALSATLAIWQRGDIDTLSEAVSVYESFWFMLGHFNVKGWAWAYTRYLPLLTGVGVGGALWTFVRRPPTRPYLLLCAAVILLTIAALAAATRQINVSQGRLLFPALGAAIGVLAVGWSRLPRWTQAAGVLPLLLLALSPAFVFLPAAYPQGQKLDALPASARPLHVCAGERCLVGYEMLSQPLAVGDMLRMRVYFTGAHPANPLFFVKALHPYTHTVIGGIDTHPAMLPSDTAGQGVYAATLRFPVEIPDDVANPFLLRLQIGWRDKRSPYDEGAYLDAYDAEGRYLKDVILDGVSVRVEVDAADVCDVPDVRFGDAVTLTHAEWRREGDALLLRVLWQFAGAQDNALRVTVGARSADGTLLAQWDGIPQAYPPAAWYPASRFLATYRLEGAGAAAELFVGWYDSVSGQRLPVTPAARDNLHRLQLGKP